MKEILGFFFENLEIRARDRDLKQQNSNLRYIQNINDDEE